MSELAQGQTHKDRAVKLKILKRDEENPLFWHNKHVGVTIDAVQRTWYQDGETTHQYYIVPKTPNGGFNGHIDASLVEEL